MLYLFLIVSAILYLLVILALFVFGLNFFYLTIRAWRMDRLERHQNEAAVVDGPHLAPGVSQSEWPRVTIQLPIYNELYVAERVIEAAARLEYPSERLQIQVLDDSTDETADIARRTVIRLQAKGLNIQHLRRTDRAGFKAGALQAGLAHATGEFIAFFDADFVPESDFLKQVLPHFDHPRVAFVQARWGHLNRQFSILAYLQSLAIDAHFMVEQYARSKSGYWFNFNGTTGIWRREALLDAGGWKADTLTEDLDISYRAHLCGWQGRYTREVVAPAELPVSMSAFRRQQHRWARGSLECALKLGPQVLQADVPDRIKIQAILHLLGYTVHLLLFVLTLLFPVMLIVSNHLANWGAIFGFGFIFNLTALAPMLFFVVGQRQLGRPLGRQIPAVLLASIAGSGLMVNTLRATWQIIRKRRNVFERTAKFGIRQRRQKWTRQRYQLQVDPIVVAEFFLGIYTALTAFLAFQMGNWAIFVYASLFSIGLLFVVTVTIAQAVAIFRSRRAEEAERQSPRHIRDRLEAGD